MEFILTNWQTILILLISVLEILLRFYPTDKNLSIIDNILKLIQKTFDKTIPNVQVVENVENRVNKGSELVRTIKNFNNEKVYKQSRKRLFGKQ
jgi:hypothetical protein